MKRTKVTTKSGKTEYRPQFSMRELADAIMDSNAGFCAACGDTQTTGIEPDARRANCGNCGKNAVYGLQEWVFMLEIGC